MVTKKYDWSSGAELQDHSKRKHKVLREYFARYLAVRCQLPQQERFRLAIVDGFAGAGRYVGGSPGSAIIFIEELTKAASQINVDRAGQGFRPIEIECFMILNDADQSAIEGLKSNVAPYVADLTNTGAKLHLRMEYLNEFFETAYIKIKSFLQAGRFRNVIFNLDQCGHSHVNRSTLRDIMQSYQSVEIFYTFAIQALLAFLKKSDSTTLATQLSALDLGSDLDALEEVMGKHSWLGAAERIVFDSFRGCARFVSPFSIHNPGGWRYWLVHFANSPKARQEYNNVLHANSSTQAHFGRPGLNMLSYDPSHDEGTLYLFDEDGRKLARNQLMDDVPRHIAEAGDAVTVGDFYESIYNITPAHSDDVNSAVIENPDIEVLTLAGGERRKANQIRIDDVLKLKNQRSFFPIFGASKRT